MSLTDNLLVFTNCVIDVVVPLIWVGLLWPLSKLAPKLESRIRHKMCIIIGNQLAFWIPASGHQCYEVGEDVSACYSEKSLVISNHQCTLDPIIMIMAFHQKGVLERTVWILDDWIKYTPFGIAAWLRADFFINQGKPLERVRLRQYLLDESVRSERQVLVLFPEGGFLRKRRLKSQSYAREHNLPVLQHVCLPRMGAFETIVSTLHPKSMTENGVCDSYEEKSLKWIIDVTIGYKPNTDIPSFETLGIFTKKPSTIALHYRKFSINEVPKDSEELKNWLYQRYEEKEELLTIYHETGQFPASLHTRNQLLKSPTPVKYGPYVATFAYLFIGISIFFQYWAIKWLVTLWAQ